LDKCSSKHKGFTEKNVGEKSSKANNSAIGIKKPLVHRTNLDHEHLANEISRPKTLPLLQRKQFSFRNIILPYISENNHRVKNLGH
jgi:hypothetical protein